MMGCPELVPPRIEVIVSLRGMRSSNNKLIYLKELAINGLYLFGFNIKHSLTMTSQILQSYSSVETSFRVADPMTRYLDFHRSRLSPTSPLSEQDN